MNPLILHPTDISQWHALIHEAQAHAQLVLNEDTESYLVFLLMRFAHDATLIESVVALDFLNAMRAQYQSQWVHMRDVGDKSLLFSGLFPGMATKRRVNLRYFRDLGQAAYLTVSEYELCEQSALYYELSQNFARLATVLQAIRAEQIAPQDPHAHAVWMEVMQHRNMN